MPRGNLSFGACGGRRNNAASTCQCVEVGDGGGEGPCSFPCGQGQVRTPQTCWCETSNPECVVQSCEAGRFFNITFCECMCDGPPTGGCPPGQWYDLMYCTCVW